MAAHIPEPEFGRLMALARGGDQQALGELLDHHRDQLFRLASSELDPKLAARVNASDVVQQTFLSACRKLENHEGQTPQEFAAWILQIHKHNLQDVVRQHAGSEKRDVRKERNSNLIDTNNAEQSTPSQQAMRLEKHDELRRFLDQLPADQKAANQYRYFEAHSLAEISKTLNRSTQAVASLLKRGLSTLRTISQQKSD